MTDEYTFPVGAIVGFHALQGEVKIKPATNNPELLLGLKRVEVRPTAHNKNIERTVIPVRAVRLDRRMLLMTFKGLNDRTAVEYLEGAELFARESELLPLEEEEFWVKDLVGMDVYSTTGELVGKVASIISGGNDILEIHRENDPPDKTILVPFVKALVPRVDMKQQRIEVIDLPGLLEPQ